MRGWVQLVPAFRQGPLHRGQFGEVLSFLRQTVHTILWMPTLSGDNHSWSGFGCALGHAHILMKTAVRYQLWAQGHSPLNILSPDPTCLVGPPGDVPASVHTMVLPGKVPLSGTFPSKRDLVWTRGVLITTFTCSNHYLLSVSLVGTLLQHGDPAHKEEEEADEDGARYCPPLAPRQHAAAHDEHPPPQRDLTEVVGMPRPAPKAYTVHTKKHID